MTSACVVAAIVGLFAAPGIALGTRSQVATAPEGKPSPRHQRRAERDRPKGHRHRKKTHRDHAGTPPNSVWSSPELWATVDVCNAPDQPDTIGIRGSMPGDGDPQDEMYMRFQVQYLQITTHTWTDLSEGGESTWMKLGRASAVRQSGQTFQFTPNPGETASFMLRGLVAFQWRLGQKVVHSTSRVTTAGHKSLAGADPAGFSSSSCPIP